MGLEDRCVIVCHQHAGNGRRGARSYEVIQNRGGESERRKKANDTDVYNNNSVIINSDFDHKRNNRST